MLGREFGGTRRALESPTPPGGICECGPEFFQRQTRLILLEEQVAELFASRNNWPRCHRKLLDCVLLIGRLRASKLRPRSGLLSA